MSAKDQQVVAEVTQACVSRISKPASSAAVAAELFQLYDLLVANVQLRRALEDSAVQPEQKSQLVSSLFGKDYLPATRELLLELSSKHWSSTGSLLQALNEAATTLLLISAQDAGQLGQVHDELQEVAQTIATQPELREIFSVRVPDSERKTDLLSRLFETKVLPTTFSLIQRSALNDTTRFEDRLRNVAQLSSTLNQQMLAKVRVVSEPSEKQLQRLAKALERKYQAPVRLQVQLDPEILGGMYISVGDEVIDGTISGRFEQVKQQLVDN